MIKLNYGVGAGFCFGILAGVVLCLPLVPFELPDSHASLIGSAFGALAAVWGAAWLVEAKERRQQESIRRHVLSELRPFRADFHRFSSQLWAALKEGDRSDMDRQSKRIQSFFKDLELHRKTLQDIQPLFLALSANGLLAYSTQIRALEDIEAILRKGMTYIVGEGMDELNQAEGDLVRAIHRLTTYF